MSKKVLLIILTVSSFSASLFAQQMFHHFLAMNSNHPPFTWTGAGSDSNWTTASNWSTSAVPGIGDVAKFDGAACSINCSPTINASISVTGISVFANYTGTITQGAGFTVTVGASGWNQLAGTFTGSDAAITMNGDFNLNGGTFTSTTGELRTFGSIDFAGGTFNSNSGSLVISAPFPQTKTMNFGNLSLNNLKFVGSSNFDGFTFNVTGTITVNGRFDIDGSNIGAVCYILGGTFILKGDASTTAAFEKLRIRSDFRIAGNGNQTISGDSLSGFTNLEIASTGGTVTFSTSFFNHGSFKYTSGTVVAPTNFNQTVEFGKTVSFNSGALNFNNFKITQDCGLDGYTVNVTGTVIINGNFEIYSSWCNADIWYNSGEFLVKGNLTSNSTKIFGTTAIRVGGSTNQTISGAGFLPNVEIASTGGTVTISDTPVIRYKFTYTSGTVSATGSTVIFNSPFGSGFTLTPGAMVFDNVTFFSQVSNDGINFNLGGGTLQVGGNLLLSHVNGGSQSSINNGHITVGKNLSATGTMGFTGTATIQLNGASASFISVATHLPSGNVTSGKTGTATSTLAANLSLAVSGQSLNISSGVLDLAGYNLAVNNVLTVSAGAKLVCNGGTVTAGSMVLTGEVHCPLSLGTTWTGATGDGLWTTAGNWTNNAVPGSTDLAFFNSACTGANCNVTINTAINVKGMKLASNYTGTITQAAGQTMTIGSWGWTQAGGTFVGGSNNITVNGAFALSAGTFTSTSATLNPVSNFSVTGSPTFNANSGTLLFSNDATLVPGTVDYNHVSFIVFCGGTFNLSGATMKVNGTLSLGSACGGGINNGTLLAKGDIVMSNEGFGGSALLKVGGSGNQTIKGVSSARILNFEIASTGGTVSLSGTLKFGYNYTYTSGTVNAGTSTLSFVAEGFYSLKPGTVQYNHVNFDSSCSGHFDLGSATMNINGILTLADGCSGSVSSGTLLAKGNIVTARNGIGGSAWVKVAGSTNQSITGIASGRISNLEIASTGGIVSISGTATIAADYTYTSGVVDFGTSTLAFTGESNRTVIPGTIDYNNVSFMPGCGGNYTLSSGTMSVNGTLTLSNGCGASLNSGTLLLKGNLTGINNGFSGTALVKVAGSGNQTLSGTSNARIPNLEIASTGGTVSFSGDIVIANDYTFTSGALSSGTSTMKFWGEGTRTIIPGSVNYNHVRIEPNCGGAYTLSSGTMNVNGNLHLSNGCGASLDSGHLVVHGDLTGGNNGFQGSALISLAGATSSNLSLSSNARVPGATLQIAKTGGSKVTMTSNANITNTSQNLTISAGTLDLGGFDLSVTSALTVSASATLICSGGYYSSASFVNNGTVNCAGFAGYAFHWTGATGDGNFSTNGNWSGGVAPTATDIPAFGDAYCGTNCNATINGNVSIKGLQTVGTYSGTITQAATRTLTVGTAGWRQGSGTFIGGNAALSISKRMYLSGGSFTSTSGTLTFNSAEIVVNSGATFNHNNGTINYASGIQWDMILLNFAGKSLNHLNISGHGSLSLPSTIPIAGNLNINLGGYASKIMGQFDLSGNLTLQTLEDGDYMIVRYLGGANQTVTTSGAAGSDSTEVGKQIYQKTAGTVTYTGNTKFFGIEHISGSVSLPAGGTTLLYNPSPCGAVSTYIAGPIQFENLTISGCGPRSISGTMVVLGDLNIDILYASAALRDGKIQVRGNYTLTRDENFSSSTEIEMVGSANKTITSVTPTSFWNPGNLTISKTGGATVTLASNLTVRNGTSGVRIASGTLNMAGWNLTIGTASGTDNKLTLESGTVINRAGGTLTYEALVNNGGTINP